MKHHHIAALFLLICGGLLAYLRLDHGDTNGAIRTGIMFALLGIFAFFYTGKVRARFRPAVVALPAILMVGMTVYAAFTGNIVSAIILGIGLIGAGVLHFFQDTPFVKEKIRPWLKPVPYVALVFVLIMLLLLLFRN